MAEYGQFYDEKPPHFLPLLHVARLRYGDRCSRRVPGAEIYKHRRVSARYPTSFAPRFSFISPNRPRKRLPRPPSPPRRPQIGFGQGGSVLQRLTEPARGCGAMLPRAATLFLPHRGTSFQPKRSERARQMMRMSE